MNSSSRNRLSHLWPIAAALAVTLLAACGQHAAAVSAPAAADVAQLGRQIFFDASLSASGKMSCATCHDPQHAYAPANGLAAQLGGAGLDRPGTRSVPSLRYALNRTPRWFKEYQSNPVERMTETDSVPTGGLTRDGRFNTLHEQALAPLLSANEMANTESNGIVGKLKQASYAAEFRRLFGEQIFARPELAFNKMLEALERFQLDDPSFRPYSSKFDQYLQGKAQLTAAEQRGQLLFVDPNKGNCAACHRAAPGADGSPPLFTDYTFANLGVPRNPRIAANADPAFYDLGLCGPDRKDQASVTAYCGMFKTPTLRNVASRKVFMHNGVFTDLADAVRFYATRESDRKRWYGKGRPYNDMPPAMRDNIDVIDAPMDRKVGDKPALTEAEVQDIVQFLRTLTDADVAS